VRAFPRPQGIGTRRSQISVAGGQFPVWREHKLFFLGLDMRIMVADYTANRDSFTHNKPEVWSDKPAARTLGFYPSSMAADGKRAAVVLYQDGAAEPPRNGTDSVTVLLNFFDEIKRLVPVQGQ